MKKQKKYEFQVWNDSDPNESFTVKARSIIEAQALALEELGWCVGYRAGDEAGYYDHPILGEVT